MLLLIFSAFLNFFYFNIIIFNDLFIFIFYTLKSTLLSFFFSDYFKYYMTHFLTTIYFVLLHQNIRTLNSIYLVSSILCNIFATYLIFTDTWTLVHSNYFYFKQPIFLEIKKKCFLSNIHIYMILHSIFALVIVLKKKSSITQLCSLKNDKNFNIFFR